MHQILYVCHYVLENLESVIFQLLPQNLLQFYICVFHKGGIFDQAAMFLKNHFCGSIKHDFWSSYLIETTCANTQTTCVQPFKPYHTRCKCLSSRLIVYTFITL
uniref:Uncharacterized protein n=1 Tax=Cacopsylla melanoneura TaxID=428564 RepID=A0A8D8LRA3_9HEMI